MNPKYICSYCGKSTYEVDIDYLSGYDHLSCVISNSRMKRKLENWNKLEGQQFSIMGVDFQFEKAEEVDSRYTIWLNENISNAPISLMRVDLYVDTMEVDIKTFVPNTFSSPPHHTNKKITKDHIKNPSIFVQTIGQMMMGDSEIRKVLDYLSEIGGNIGARSGMSGGIVNKVINTGTSVKYSSGGASSGFNGSSATNLW